MDVELGPYARPYYCRFVQYLHQKIHYIPVICFKRQFYNALPDKPSRSTLISQKFTGHFLKLKMKCKSIQLNP